MSATQEIPSNFVVPFVSDSHWQNKGTCNNTDPDAFFNASLGRHKDGDPTEQALLDRTCNVCPVRPDCLAYALVNKIPDGVWGGMPKAKRAKLHGSFRKYGAIPLDIWEGAGGTVRETALAVTAAPAEVVPNETEPTAGDSPVAPVLPIQRTQKPITPAPHPETTAAPAHPRVPSPADIAKIIMARRGPVPQLHNEQTSSVQPDLGKVLNIFNHQRGPVRIGELVEKFYGAKYVANQRFKYLIDIVGSLLEQDELVKLGDGYYVLTDTPLGRSTLATGDIEQKIDLNTRPVPGRLSRRPARKRTGRDR